MANSLQPEFEYFLAHRAELERAYNGKVVVIKNATVVGAYGSETEAVTEGAKQFELGTFLVQKIAPGADGSSQTFHSRVAFV